MPRVGYVLKRYPRYSETFIVNEILAHEAAGLQIEIYALGPSGDTHFQDIISQVRAPVHYLPHGEIKSLKFWRTLQECGDALPGFWEKLKAAGHVEYHEVLQAAVLAKTARLNGIGHLHAHFATSATTVARLAGLFADLPYTFTAHAKDIFHDNVDPADLERKIADAAGIVTVSDYNIRYLEERYRSAAGRIRRIYNGLELEAFRYRSPLQRPPCIVAVGRFVEKKGFCDLISACSLLADRGIVFDCEIVGTGELETELREQIRSLGLENVVQLTGPLPQGEVIKRIQYAAVFASPFVIGKDGNRDGLPTTLLEAMALGTPCISTDVTGVPEILQNDETGLMVPQNQAPVLASAIEMLISDPKKRVRLAEAARSLVEKTFRIEKNTASLRDLFVSVHHKRMLIPGEVK